MFFLHSHRSLVPVSVSFSLPAFSLFPSYFSLSITPFSIPCLGLSSFVSISALEWQLIGTLDLYSVGQLPATIPEPVDYFLREKDVEGKNKSREKEKKIQKLEELAREEAMEEVKNLIPLGRHSLHRIHRILCQLRSTGRAQSGLNGKGSDARNMWIVKPAAKSRGRGISTFADLPKLLKYIEAGSGFSGQWVVQKYMENSLVIAKRKFDLRQWVVVTNWNPLTIWMFRECYARFSAQDYDTLDNNMDNNYVHLVNNSITKDHKLFHSKVVAENGEEVEDCMWSQKQLSDWIKFKAKKVRGTIFYFFIFFIFYFYLSLHRSSC